MKPLPEQIEALPILDDLKREEAELGGPNWNPIWWDRGQVHTNGWSTKAGEFAATAAWIPVSFSAPCATRATISTLMAVGRTLSLAVLTEGFEVPGCWLEIERTATGKAKVKISAKQRGAEEELLASAETTLAAGDSFALTYEEGPGGLKGFRKAASGSWAEVVSADAPLEAGAVFASLSGLILTGPEGTTGGPERITNFGAGELELAATGPLKTFRIAIATNLTTPITRADDILVCQWWNSERISAAHKHGSRVLIYQNLTRAEEPEGGLYGTGLTLEQAQELGAATTELDPDAGYICLPGTAGYAAAWLAAATARAEEVGADGVFCDDMNTWGEGGGSEAVSEEEWLDQMEACNAVVGPGISGAGLLAIANMAGATGQRNAETDGWVERQFQYYDGGFDEFFITWPGETIQPQAFYEESMRVMWRVQRQGKLYLAACNGKAATIEFALGVVLLQTDGNGRYFATADVDYGTQSWPAGLETALKLGAPTANKIQTGETTWTRQFENGTVEVDFESRTPTIEL